MDVCITAITTTSLLALTSEWLYSIIEANVGLICACLPALKALFQRHVPSLFSRMYAYPKLSKLSETRSSVADRERHDSEVELKEAGIPSNGIEVTTEVRTS